MKAFFIAALCLTILLPMTLYAQEPEPLQTIGGDNAAIILDETGGKIYFVIEGKTSAVLDNDGFWTYDGVHYNGYNPGLKGEDRPPVPGQDKQE